MWKQHLLWQTDGRGKLVTDANGYKATVERLPPENDSMFTIGWLSDLGPVAIVAIRPTTKIALADAEMALARLPVRLGWRREVLLEADLIEA